MKDAIFCGLMSLLTTDFLIDDVRICSGQKEYIKVTFGINARYKNIEAPELAIKQESDSDCKIEEICAQNSTISICGRAIFRGHWNDGRLVNVNVAKGSTAYLSFQPSQTVNIILKEGSEVIYFGNPKYISIMRDPSCTVRKANWFDSLNWYRS